MSESPDFQVSSQPDSLVLEEIEFIITKNSTKTFVAQYA